MITTDTAYIQFEGLLSVPYPTQPKQSERLTDSYLLEQWFLNKVSRAASQESRR